MNDDNTPYFKVGDKLMTLEEVRILNKEKFEKEIKLIESRIALKEFRDKDKIKEMDDQLYDFLKDGIKPEASTFSQHVKDFFKDYDYELLRRNYNILRLIVTKHGSAFNGKKESRFW